MAPAPQFHNLTLDVNEVVPLGDGSPSLASTIAIQITGSWTGTIRAEGTLDNTNYLPLLMTPVDGSTAATTTDNNGIFWIDLSALSSARLRVTVGSAGGTAVVTYRPVEG